MKVILTKFRHENGFTLVELMITVVVSGIIVAAIYSTYIIQQRTYTDQDAVVEMQQNLRAALMLMSREIRMAGYDPDGSAGAGITAATAGTITFTQVADDDNVDNDNADGDGDSSTGADEPGDLKTIQYDVYDAYNDGVSDIGRQVGNSASTKRALAENIEQLEFNYRLSDGSTTTSPTSGELNQIRAVQVSILARAGTPDREFINTKLYCPASHPNHNLTTSPPQCEDSAGDSIESATWGPYNDNYRRRLLITTIQCRNMGL